MTHNPEQSTLTRRRFLKSVGGSIALLGFPTIIPSSALGKNGKPPPSERITVGVLGCGNRSRLAYAYERQGGQIAALADPLGRRLEKWKSGGPLAGRTLPEYADFRELLARDDIDAIHIATGDYWHVPMALLAARAGKNIFVEKPLALSIEQALACREIIEDMRGRGWGRIINIASIAGLAGAAYISAYCAAKHGVVGLTRSLAMELARHRITVNALCPGYTSTDLLDGAIENIMGKTSLGREAAEEQLKKVNPQHRFIEPQEVAASVAWLCLPGSEGINGQAISITGGGNQA